MAELIIYGRNGCGMCRNFKSQLEAEGIRYRMVDCDVDAGNQEMWAKCSEGGITGSVGLPVVDVYGKTSIRPSIADVKARMSHMGKPLPPKKTAPARRGGGGRTYQVEIPAGASPGDQMQVSINGENVTVVIPQGAKPGDKMSVNLDQPAAAPRGGSDGSKSDMEDAMQRDIERIQKDLEGTGRSLAGVSVSKETKGNVETTETTFTMSDGSTRVETKTITRG